MAISRATLPVPAPTSQQTAFSVRRSLLRLTARTSLLVMGTFSSRWNTLSGRPGVSTASGLGFSISTALRLSNCFSASSEALPEVTFSSG